MSKLSHPSYASFVSNFVHEETGEFVKYGDFIVREDLARTLEMVKQHGADAFYHGSLGENFVKMVSGCGCGCFGDM